MGKILLYVSIVVTLLAAGIGVMNRSKIANAAAAQQSSDNQAAQAKAQLVKKEAELKAASKSLADATTKLDQTSGNTTAIQAKADAATSQLNDLTTQKAASDTALAQAKSDLDAANAKIKEISTAPPAPSTAPTSEQTARLAEDQTLIAQLQTNLDTAHGQLDNLQKLDAARKQHIMQNVAQGRVLAVNPAWNFVVLNLGDKNGAVSNAELIVKRGTKMVGKVRITSVEPSTSIADIVANSVPNGTNISPGDQVIYQAVTE